MLVLSRRESERIKLGDSIVVTVVKVAGDRVRLGDRGPHERAGVAGRTGAAPRRTALAAARLGMRPRPVTVPRGRETAEFFQ